MQERNFEKQVQKKMEELSFVPSAPVWQKVEEQIRKKKERRRIIFWLLPVVLVTGGVYFLLNENKLSSNREASVATVETEQSKNNLNTEEKMKEERLEKLNANPNYIEQQNNTTLSKKNFTALSKASLQQNIALGKRTNKNIEQQQKERRFKATEEPIVVAPGKEKPEDLINNNTSQTSEKSPDTERSEPQNSNSKAVAFDSLSHKEIGKNSTTAPVIAEKKDSVANKDSAAKAVKFAKPIVTKKWQWSGYVEAGISKLTTNSAKSMPSAARTSDLLSFNGANLQAAAPAPSQDNSFTLNNDLAFALGASVQKNISKRFSIRAGLQYNYFSAWNYVGKSVSNTTQNGRLNSQIKASSFYLASSTEKEKYTNKYHYVGIPVTVQWQMFERFPLQVNGGFNISRLVGTNALYFDGLRQIYYKDEDHFNKNRFALTGGLSYRFLQTNKLELYAGPQAEVGLNSLYKENTSGKHLFFGGLHTEVRF